MDHPKSTDEHPSKAELQRQLEEVQRQNAGQARKISKMVQDKEVAAMRSKQRERSILVRKDEEIDNLKRENNALKTENDDLKSNATDLMRENADLNGSCYVFTIGINKRFFCFYSLLCFQFVFYIDSPGQLKYRLFEAVT
ncbi:hypothetical protein N7540_005541 [Penicillium herquei]|nr:hypothetical protein N7540_005541 [Penicillium herquei]